MMVVNEDTDKYVDLDKSNIPITNLVFYCNNPNCWQQKISVMYMRFNEFLCPMCKEGSLNITVYDAKLKYDKSSDYWRLRK